MNRPVGDIFEYRGIKYCVEEDEGCERCDADTALCSEPIESSSGYCSKSGRSDGLSVIFVRVDDET